MYTYSKLTISRLQVSVGNLILELSTRCVRMGGVETQVVLVLYARLKVSKCPSAQCYYRADALQEFSPRQVNEGGQKNN